MVISTADFLLFPVYFLFLLVIVMFRSKKYNGTPLKNYFIGMFLLHAFGSFVHSMVLQYYYTFGDAFIYFQGGEFIKKLITGAPAGFKWLFADGSALFDHPDAEMLDNYARYSLNAPSSLAIIKITGVLSVFSFSTFLVNALFCGFISFIGTWKLFRTFDDILKNQAQKPLALLMIFTPTIWFWGSAMGKDSITLGITGLIVSGLYQLFVKRNSVLKNAMIITICIWLLWGLKGSAAGIIIVAAAAYMLVALIGRVQNVVFKLLLFMMFAAGLVIAVSLGLDEIQNSLDDAQKMIESNVLTYTMESEGSEGGFEPPSFDVTPAGIAAAAPAIVIKTLFRPFLWEVRNPMILLSALESLAMLLGLLYVFGKTGIFRSFGLIFSKPPLMYAFVFCLLFALIIGFTTFNSGTLVRYRLPLLPFYIFLAIGLLQFRKTKISKDITVRYVPPSAQD